MRLINLPEYLLSKNFFFQKKAANTALMETQVSVKQES